MYRMNKLYGKLERATRSLIYFTTRSWEVTNITLGLQFNLSLRTPLYYGRFVWSQKCQKSYIHYLYRVFSFTWPAYLQIYCNKRKSLHKKRVQLPGDWFRTPTWPPFHCFGTPIWPPWRHVKTLYNTDTSVKRILGSVPLVSVLKRFDSITLKHSLVHFVVHSTYFFYVPTNGVAPPFDM